MNCPDCASNDILPITYGTPPLSGSRLQRAIEKQEIILGGCFLCGDAPKYACRACGHRFDLPEEKQKKPGKIGEMIDKLMKK